MGIFEDWFIGEILSFFAGEVEGTWHDAIEMNRRRKELEDSLRRMLEDEKEGQYYNVLSRTLHNSRVLHDCLAFYMDEMPVVDVKNRIDVTLERERLSISEANYVAGFLKKMVDCVRKVMLKPGSAEEQRLVSRINEIMTVATNGVERIKRIENVLVPQKENQVIDYEELSEKVQIPSVFIRRYLVKDNAGAFLLEQPRFDPLEVLASEAHIVILNDAGFGKTFALRQIYCDAKKQGAQPVFLSLKYNPFVLNVICSSKNASMKHLVLILDGYDEIAPDYFEQITSMIRNLAGCKEKPRIVVSARGNFYRENPLEGFIIYQLSELNADDKMQYFRAREVDQEKFWSQVVQKSLADMCGNAFYLTRLVDIWKEKGELPDCADVMEKIVDFRIYEDQRKYQVVDPDMGQKTAAIKNMLMRAAFIMQCMHRTYLTKEDMIRAFSSDGMKDLEMQGLLYLGEKNQWSFEHNNFREYFAAVWLNRLDFGQIIRFVAFPNRQDRIRPSWVNVLSYLAVIRRKRDLQEWIAQSIPKLVTMFERDRFSAKERYEWFVSICNKHEEEETWLSQDDFDMSRKIAAFATSDEAVYYVLDKLTQKLSLRQVKNLLRILQHFGSLYTHRELGEQIISEMAFDSELPVHTRMDALNVMGAFPEVFSSYADRAEKTALNSNDGNYRYFLCRFIDELGCLEEHFGVIINELEHGEYYDEDVVSNREWFLGNVLCSVRSKRSVLSILKHYSEHPRQYDSELFKKAFGHCCDEVEKYVADERNEFIDVITKIFLEVSIGYDRHAIHRIREFMIRTHTETAFYNAIICADNLRTLYAFEELMCPSFVQTLVDNYLSDKFTDEATIMRLIQWCPESDECRMILVQAVFRKTGEIVEFPPLVDREGLRRKGHQVFFDGLFTKDDFMALVDRLGEKLGTEISIEDQRFIEDDSIADKAELQDCYFVLRWIFCGKETTTLQEAREYVSNEWDELQYWLICLALKRLGTKIQLDAKQRLWIEEESLLRFRQMNIDQPSGLDSLVTETLERMDVRIPEELYGKALLIPLWMWAQTNTGKYPEYVLNQIPQGVIREVILHNVANLPLKDSIAAAHIRYCEENGIGDIKDLAMEFLLREDSRYYQHTVLNYLNKLYGFELIVRDVLPRCEENELLQSIANLVPCGFRSSMLDEKLYEAYRQTGDSYYQGMLIRRNNRSALEAYYQVAEAKNQIPDYPRSNNVPTLTETIRSVSDIALLDIIIDLLRLTCRSGFGDEAHFGLRNSCWSALRNMATAHYDEVLERLTEERKSEDQTYRLTCIDIITNITSEDLVCTDVGMSFTAALTLTVR